MKQIPIVPAGAGLIQGATYIDLKAANPEPFRAMGSQVADKTHWYIPKDEVPYTVWNLITGVDNPARLDEPPRDEP